MMNEEGNTIKDQLIAELKHQLKLQQEELAKRDELIARISLDLAVLSGDMK